MTAEIEPSRQAAMGAAVRDAKVLRLYAAGMNVAQISKATSLSFDDVRAATRRALREYMEPTTNELVARQHYLIAELRRAVFNAATRGEPGAWDRLMRTLEHEARLTGLYSLAGFVSSGNGDDFETVTSTMLAELLRLQGPGALAAALGINNPEPATIVDAEPREDEQT